MSYLFLLLFIFTINFSLSLEISREEVSDKAKLFEVNWVGVHKASEKYLVELSGVPGEVLFDVFPSIHAQTFFVIAALMEP